MIMINNCTLTADYTLNIFLQLAVLYCLGGVRRQDVLLSIAGQVDIGMQRTYLPCIQPTKLPT